MSPDAVAWARGERSLSEATLARLPVGSGTVFFPDKGQKLPSVFFQYREGWKARAYPEKAFVAGGGFKLCFWNLDAVLQGDMARVFIVEGELDACALVEAGVPPQYVLSVPNGAKERPADDPKEQRGYNYVQEALRAGLSRAKKFIWCGDADSPGHALRADMVRLLGAARFHFVDWPDGIKDANDMLRKDSAQDLLDLITNGAQPWPIEGLYRLSELPDPPQLVLWNPGFAEWESKVRLAPRTLSVVTGHPGHGKTAMWAQIWFQVVKQYSVPACIASFETRPKPHYRRILRTLLTGKLEKDMEFGEHKKADQWIDDRYLFVVHPEQNPSLEWFLDKAEVAVVRHGARIVQADPWNRMEASRARDETETEYIGRCLRNLHAFAHDMNVHVQILAHPAKMGGDRKNHPPLLEDISGSKNWDNMVDQGFVVHRPKMFDETGRKTEADFYHRKARFDELGYPCLLKMNYKLSEGRYVSSDYSDY
jgi:twinkle protein